MTFALARHQPPLTRYTPPERAPADSLTLYIEFQLAWEHRAEDFTAIGRLLIQSTPHAVRQSACAAALRHWRLRPELRQDVLLETACHILCQAHRSKLTYTNVGFEAWKGWLWHVWYCACRNACRRAFYRWTLSPLPDQEVLIAPEAAGGFADIDDHDEIKSAIDHLPAKLAPMARDWAEGLRAHESAALRGLAPYEVSRRRSQALVLLRRALLAADSYAKRAESGAPKKC